MLFDTKADRKVRRLTDADLARCQEILDRMESLTCVESWLLLRDLRLAREELAAPPQGQGDAMKRALTLLAMPLYAVAIAVEVLAVAYRAAQRERRLQREAHDAVARHRSDLRVEFAKHRNCSSYEREWWLN
jgi:hypothetical protein